MKKHRDRLNQLTGRTSSQGSVYAALVRALNTGDFSHIIPAVWEQTEERVQFAIRIYTQAPTESSARLLGSLAGLCFAHREHYYDNKKLNKGTN